jgi:hypothetical protein
LDNAFDLVNRIWRYSGNQINTVVFMICLKKELLRAYASSSSISVLCVITLWQMSNAWQGKSSVQDKFCSKQTQPLLQTDLPLHVHARSCKKSDDIWSSNNTSSRPNFPSVQPCSKGDPTAGFGICAFNHIFVLYEDLRECWLNVSSLGGSLTKVESLIVAYFTHNLFRTIWHRFDFPFGSYSLDISFRLRSTELSMSEHSIREKSLNWLGVSYRSFNIDFFPMPKNE